MLPPGRGGVALRFRDHARVQLEARRMGDTNFAAARRRRQQK